MSLRETSPDYDHVLCPLGPDHRIIESPDNNEWIIQKQTSHNRWTSVFYFRTSTNLKTFATRLNPEAAAAIPPLPEFFDEQAREKSAKT